MWREIILLAFFPITFVESSWSISNHKSPKSLLPRSNGDPSLYRLPSTTVPEHYELTFTIDPSLTTFTGETRIRIRALEETKSIVLHSYRLAYTRYVLKDKGGAVIPADVTVTPSDRQFLMFDLTGGKILDVNETYELDFAYSGQYSVNSFTGIYKSSYIDVGGKRQYFVRTQFQATHARDAFPCFDEPSLKATFSVHIYIPDEYHVISNMDVINSNMPPIGNLAVTSFRTTPPMSTYLLGFLISDFDRLSNTASGNILYPREYRTYARIPNVVFERLDYALDFGQRAMLVLQAITDVVYRLPKMDSVALPGVRTTGSESWGVVAYNEDYQFYEKGVTNSEWHTKVTTAVAHEVSHMWFGNELTPSWWDHVWLKEGFATYFEFYASDKVLSSTWRLEHKFVVSQLQSVLLEDSFSTNPLNNAVASPMEINLNFNAIASLKGAAIIRMMQYIFGEAAFRMALANYVKSRPNGVTDPNHLYSELQKVVGNQAILPPNTTVAEIFKTWADQAGYPLVTIASIADGTSILLTQERFHYNSSHKTGERWWIPFTFITNTNPSFVPEYPQLFPPHLPDYYITTSSRSWYIANRQQMGYFRVMYDATNWRNLRTVLEANNTILHPLNRAQLIDDSMMFSRTGRMGYNDTLQLIYYLRKELDLIPWMSALNGLNWLRVKMQASEEKERYDLYVRKIIQLIYGTSGFVFSEEDSYLMRRTRVFALDTACQYGLEDCLLKSRSALSDEIANVTVNKLDRDMKEIAYCHGSQTQDLWDYVMTKYDPRAIDSERRLVLKSLACSTDDEIIDSYLNMTITNSGLLDSDKEFVMQSIIMSGYFGVGKVLDFLQEHFGALKNNLVSEFATIFLILDLGSVIVSDEHIQAFEAFKATYSGAFDVFEQMAVNSATETIQESLTWIDTYMNDIKIWLLENIS